MCSLMDWACLKAHQDGVVLLVRVSPNAAKTTAEGLRQDRLSLRVKAPPVEGKANEAVCAWVGKAFGLRPSRVRLLRGDKSREKDLLLEGLPPEAAARTLDAMIGTKS